MSSPPAAVTAIAPEYGRAVDPRCTGERAACIFRNPQLVFPSLPCQQRCMFGAEAPGSPAWYRVLLSLVAAASGPVYLVGAAPAAGALASLERRGVRARTGFTLDTAALAAQSAPSPHGLTRSARRDARRALRNGLTVEISSTRAAIEAFYEVYVDNCAAHRIVPLPIDFVLSERDRAEAGFAVALCRHRGEVVGGRLLVAQDGVARIVEGATRRAARGLGAEELLTAAAVAWGAEQGASTLDYGITEPSADGLRAFKRRMGFVHTRPVVELQAMAVRAPAPPAPDRPAFLPAREDIALLERCNFACGFCYREPWVPELEVEAIHRRLAEVAARGNVGIAFSGGEPTLRAELPALVAHARELGITDIQLHTNGWRTAEPGYAAALAKAGLGSAMVSLHSHHAEGFAAITRTRSGAFERTLAGIDALRQAGVYTLLSHVVNALNYTELSAYFRFVAARFPKAEVFLFFVYPSVKGRQHPELYPRLSDVEPHWVRGLQEARRLGVAVTVDSLAGLPLCFMRGFEGASRYAYAHAQEAATDGRVDDHRVKAPEMRQGRACGQCRHSQTCPGFWSEYLDAHGDHELVPVP